MLNRRDGNNTRLKHRIEANSLTPDLKRKRQRGLPIAPPIINLDDDDDDLFITSPVTRFRKLRRTNDSNKRNNHPIKRHQTVLHDYAPDTLGDNDFQPSTFLRNNRENDLQRFRLQQNNRESPLSKKRSFTSTMSSNRLSSRSSCLESSHSSDKRRISPYPHANKTTEFPNSSELLIPKRTTSQSNILTINKKRTINQPLPTNFVTSSSSELVIPDRRRMKTAPSSTMALLSDFPDDHRQETDEGNQVECPYCRTRFSLDASEVVALAYGKIKREDKLYEEQQSTIHKSRRPVANMDQYSFCLLHTIELVIKPQGDENDWPTVIPFCTLKDRILGFQDELDNVIDNKLDSSYRQAALEAYKKMGTNQARSTMGVMTRLETILPGYYGTKGASVIQEHLVEMYLHSGKLTSKVTSPQLPLEYLQHVLVPEVGFRLIREDLINKNSSKQYEPDLDDQAKQIMAESSNFGSYLQPLGWDDGTLLDENDDIDDSNDDHTSDNDDDDDCYIIH